MVQLIKLNSLLNFQLVMSYLRSIGTDLMYLFRHYKSGLAPSN